MVVMMVNYLEELGLCLVELTVDLKSHFCALRETLSIVSWDASLLATAELLFDELLRCFVTKRGSALRGMPMGKIKD